MAILMLAISKLGFLNQHCLLYKVRFTKCQNFNVDFSLHFSLFTGAVSSREFNVGDGGIHICQGLGVPELNTASGGILCQGLVVPEQKNVPRFGRILHSSPVKRIQSYSSLPHCLCLHSLYNLFSFVFLHVYRRSTTLTESAY